MSIFLVLAASALAFQLNDLAGMRFVEPANTDSSDEVDTESYDEVDEIVLTGGHGPKCSPRHKTGYLKNIQTLQYLACDSSSCRWSKEPVNQFRQIPRKGQAQFRILNVNGTDMGTCLDRVNCHKGKSGARAGSCSHCGAKHWNLCSNYLAEDGMQNCIQTDGSIAHCKSSHASVKFEAAVCKVTRTEIRDLKCVSETTGGACEGEWKQNGKNHGASSKVPCNACSAKNDTSLTCSFDFSYSTTAEQTWHWQNAVGMEYGTSFTAGMDIGIASISATASFKVSDTFTWGKSKKKSATAGVRAGCSVTVPGGTEVNSDAVFLTGTIMARFTATQVTHYSCPSQPIKTKTISSTLTVTNVPTQTMVGACKIYNVPCRKKSRSLLNRLD